MLKVDAKKTKGQQTKNHRTKTTFRDKRLIENYSVFDHERDAAKHHFGWKNRLDRGQLLRTTRDKLKSNSNLPLPPSLFD